MTRELEVGPLSKWPVAQTIQMCRCTLQTTTNTTPFKPSSVPTALDHDWIQQPNKASHGSRDHLSIFINALRKNNEKTRMNLIYSTFYSSSAGLMFFLRTSIPHPSKNRPMRVGSCTFDRETLTFWDVDLN